MQMKCEMMSPGLNDTIKLLFHLDFRMASRFDARGR